MQILPTTTHLLGHYSGVYCFGPGENRYDWSLNDLQTSRDVLEKISCFELFCRLNNITKTAGKKPIHTLYSPRLDQLKANLVVPHDFPSKITHDDHELTLFRGAVGSGMEVPPNAGVFFPTGDCPVVIVRSPISSRIIAAHAGLKELIDFNRLLTERPSRQNHSVIETMIDQFPADEICQLQLSIVCGIGPACYTHPVDHPEFGEANRKIIAHIQSLKLGRCCVHNAESAGRVNIASLIASQAMTLGLVAPNIFSDYSDTYTEMTGEEGVGTYKWWSYRRARDEEKVEEMSKRNGILVINPLMQA